MARALAWHARGRRFDPDTLHDHRCAEKLTGFLLAQPYVSTRSQKNLSSKKGVRHLVIEERNFEKSRTLYLFLAAHVHCITIIGAVVLIMPDYCCSNLYICYKRIELS